MRSIAAALITQRLQGQTVSFKIQMAHRGHKLMPRIVMNKIAQGYAKRLRNAFSRDALTVFQKLRWQEDCDLSHLGHAV